jgi:hypothetical protein
VIALTIQHWMGPTHTISGVNYADAWHGQLQVIGWLLVMTGIFMLVRNARLVWYEDTCARVASVTE